MGWPCHVVRLDDKRTPKRVLLGSMDGNRAKGRPRKRWEDAVAVDAREMLRGCEDGNSLLLIERGGGSG